MLRSFFVKKPTRCSSRLAISYSGKARKATRCTYYWKGKSISSLVILCLGPGALLGEMALIDDTPRTANAVAKSPSRLAQIDRRRFHFLVQQTPRFSTHVMKILADRLRHTNAVMAAREEISTSL
ncbi:MAG: hypothetical protein DMF08_06915 [Verrucomicrobia bacterium]|nr:MAG: hypothetical protein DMF08_06915 [Verrucomicrobiota bacterium]